MKCSDFEHRMQCLIDANRPLDDDQLLQSHARLCPDCQQLMIVWQQIDSVLSIQPSSRQPPSRQPRPHSLSGQLNSSWSLIAALAAVLLLGFFVQLPRHEEEGETVIAAQSFESDEQQAIVDPARWWRHVQDRDWIGQTMPAVHSVRDGVAPLGRSLLQAVAILTTGRGETTS